MGEEADRWTAALIAKGHEPVLNVQGDLDMFALEFDQHNGPGCSRCHWSCCEHCHDVSDADIPECSEVMAQSAAFGPGPKRLLRAVYTWCAMAAASRAEGTYIARLDDKTPEPRWYGRR